MVFVYWKMLYLDVDVYFDKVVELDVVNLLLIVFWGLLLEDVVFVEGVVLNLEEIDDENCCVFKKCVFDYMGLELGIKIIDIKIDWVFIGFCINGWIEDFWVVVVVIGNYKVVFYVNVMVVLGLGLVKEQVEEEGFDVIFKEVGFEWCELGCFMCFVMNVDKLVLGECCVFIFNWNFEGW